MAVEKEQEIEQGFPEKIHEYIEIENLVLTYKKQFFSDATRKEIEESKSAATLLTIKFNPLFRKYIKLIKDNQLDLDRKSVV